MIKLSESKNRENFKLFHINQSFAVLPLIINFSIFKNIDKGRYLHVTEIQNSHLRPVDRGKL